MNILVRDMGSNLPVRSAGGWLGGRWTTPGLGRVAGVTCGVGLVGHLLILAGGSLVGRRAGGGSVGSPTLPVQGRAVGPCVISR